MPNGTGTPPPTNRPLSAVTAPTVEPDVQSIRSLAQAALSEGPLPRHERLEELDRELRAQIELLMPSAEAAVDELWHGSTDWYNRRRRLDEVRYHLAGDLGEGLLSATIQVRHLAHDCNLLLKYMEAER